MVTGKASESEHVGQRHRILTPSAPRARNETGGGWVADAGAITSPSEESGAGSTSTRGDPSPTSAEIQGAAAPGWSGVGGLQAGMSEEETEQFQQAVALRACRIATARALCDLAHVKARQGLDADAESHASRALLIYEDSLGHDHDSTLRALAALMQASTRQRKTKEAEELCAKAEAQYEKSAGRKLCAGRGLLACEMAIVYASQGKLEAAVQRSQESVKQCRETLGERSLETSHALHTLATLYLDLDRNPESESVAAESLAAIENVNGLNHISTVPLRSTLIEVLRRLGRYQDADYLVQISLEIVSEALGERHPATAHILIDRSILREALGDLAGRDAAIRQAVVLMETSPEVFPEAYIEKQRARYRTLTAPPPPPPPLG